MSKPVETRWVRRAMVDACLATLFVLPLSYAVASFGIADAGKRAIDQFVTFNLLVAEDTWVGPAMAVAVLGAWWAASRFRGRWQWPLGGWVIAATAVLSCALTVFLRVRVHHDYDVSLDEFMPRFQAEIFRSGHWMARLDPDWFALNKYLQTFLAYADDRHGLWASHYRPVHAALLSLWNPAISTPVLHGLLVAVSVVAMASAARRVFPAHPGAPFLAVGLLLASPQFLLTAASGFSFTAHLAFNLVWLALFLRGGWIGHILAAFVGFWAIGLHQIHVHPLFAAPFLLALLLGMLQRRVFVLPYIVSYGLALPIWVLWLQIAPWLETGDTSSLPRSLGDIEYLSNYVGYVRTVGVYWWITMLPYLVVNVFRFLAWVAPAIPPLTFLGIFAARRIGMVPLLAGYSFLLTVAAMAVLMPTQMHGWGARYYNPVLGCLVLFAMGGFYAVMSSDVGPRLARASAVLVLAGLLVFLPWRAVQVDAKVGPRAAVQRALESIDADVVVVDIRNVWFGIDFVRNDPFLRKRPIMMTVNSDEIPRIPATSYKIVTGEDLIRFGLPVGTFLEPDLRP